MIEEQNAEKITVTIGEMIDVTQRDMTNPREILESRTDLIEINSLIIDLI